jgi:hypothetical protein
MVGPVCGDHRTADYVGMAVDVFGGRMDHQIGTQRDRLLQGRGQEGVVDRDLRPRRMGAATQVGDIDDAHQWIGRGLDQDQFRLPGEGFVKGGGIPLVDEFHVEMVAARPGRQQAVGAAVTVVRGDQQITGLQ